MEKPSNLLLKLTRRLFENLDNQEKFIEALIAPQSLIPVSFGARINQKSYRFQ